MEEALRRGEDELSKAAGRLKCNSCAPLIVKSGNCLVCIREAGNHTCGLLSTASGRFGPAARAFIFQKIAHDGATEMDGIVAWKREKEKEKLAHRELSKLQTMDRRHQVNQAESAAFDDNESLMKEAKAQADEMFDSMTVYRTANRYEVLKLLGDGTFGRVLLCKDKVAKKEVAVKVIRDVKRRPKTKTKETNPVKYLSHRYFHKDGKWRCEYDNIAKLFHLTGMRLSGERDKTTPGQNEKMLAAIAGQRFVLRNAPQADDTFVELIHHLASNFAATCRFQ
ncbi:PGM2 [Symbiodinium microadriaticum]|nr:PGM2 [Symbiodinium microadriaticum]